MLNKLYDKTKENFLKNLRFIITLILLTIIFTIQFPYTIDAPGGYINVTDRIELDNDYESDGSFNMAYVAEITATIPTLFYAWLNPKWDISKNEDILMENDTIEDLLFRNKLALQEANNNAIMVAYDKAGYDYTINSEKYYVAYIDENAKTNLKVGDLITSIDDISINSKQEIQEIIEEKNVGDKITFKVKNEEKEYEKYANIIQIEGAKKIGVAIYEILDLETTPTINIKNDESESGPSGGLMTSLAIYNALIQEDLTGGHKIVGTGTIERDGTVGSIGGVKYKLLGAIKNKAKVFIIPNGENYEEAMQLKKDNNYNIEIVGVSSFDDAIKFLKEYNARK